MNQGRIQGEFPALLAPPRGSISEGASMFPVSLSCQDFCRVTGGGHHCGPGPPVAAAHLNTHTDISPF